MDCPRCDGTLQPRTVEGVHVDVCDGCTGTLVPVNRLVPLLDAMSGPLLHVLDPDEPIEPSPDDGVHVTCPHCRRTMEPFGYLGMKTVIVDRCSDDMVIWADAGELGVMSVLHAKTTRRTEAMELQASERRNAMARRTSLALSARERSSRVAGAMLTGAGHMGAGYGSVWSLVDAIMGRYDE